MENVKTNKLPPGPKTLHPLGHLIPFRRDSLRFLKKVAAAYGDIVRFRLGPLRVVLLNHPDYLKEVLTVRSANFVKGRPLEMAKELLGDGLLTSEGEFHKRHSRIIQPAFHRKMIESYGAAMTEYAKRSMSRWEDGQEIDMMEEMVQMSTAIAGKTLFGVDMEKEAPEIGQALEDVMSQFGRITLPLSEWLLKLPLPGSRRFYRARARLDETIYRIIDVRRKDRRDNGDLLSLLLQAQEEGEGGEGLSDREIRDEALTLFLTAFDTTSLALTWTWYLLSQHPEVEAEMHRELDRLLQGRMPAVADVPALKFTRSVLGEAMRLYPPIYVISRQALEDFSLEGYLIPGGTIILLSPYLIHRDARFHPAPDRFDPWSWEEHTQGLSAKYTYFPFSRGPRACIGESYAWMEGVLVLAAMAQQWRMKLVEGHPVALQQLINLRPKYGMRMRVERRSAHP